MINSVNIFVTRVRLFCLEAISSANARERVKQYRYPWVISTRTDFAVFLSFAARRKEQSSTRDFESYCMVFIFFFLQSITVSIVFNSHHHCIESIFSAVVAVANTEIDERNQLGELKLGKYLYETWSPQTNRYGRIINHFHQTSHDFDFVKIENQSQDSHRFTTDEM